MTTLADELLEAHVRHELERLTGVGLEAVIDDAVTSAFRWLESVKLNQVATPAQVIAVIDRYVVQLKISGGIAELAGEMANVVFSSAAGTDTRLEDVLPPEAYEEFSEKVASLGNVQRELIRHVSHSAAFRSLACRVAARMLTEQVLARVTPSTRHAAVLGDLAARLSPGVERRISAFLSRFVEPHAKAVGARSGGGLFPPFELDWVRQLADELWDEISARPIGDAALVFTAQDLEDFVVLGFEFWLNFRKTKYFRSVSTEVVNGVFEKYGEESVGSVIQDMGITNEMLAGELRSFLPPLLDHALRTGFLEQRIRARLEPFYRSQAFANAAARRE